MVLRFMTLTPSQGEGFEVSLTMRGTRVVLVPHQ
jgi:hypothetical protein